MLLGDFALKLSTYFASLAGLAGIMDPNTMKQNPLELSKGSNLMLSDKLTIQPSASIFFSYARESTLGKMLEEDGQLTVFAPTNRAVMALARKP